MGAQRLAITSGANPLGDRFGGGGACLALVDLRILSPMASTAPV